MKKAIGKEVLILVLSSVSVFVNAQIKNETVMKSFTITQQKLTVNSSSTSSQNDFDFLVGKWKVVNRKLKERLNNSHAWDEFESEIHMRKTLNGLGNVENYFAMFDGKRFEGMAVRLFNPETRLWTIYWMDTSSPVMDQHPVTGSFENGLGKFYAKDSFKGIDIIVLYQWDVRNPESPKWSQAFSTDEGNNWEWNWEMTLTRMK